MNVAPGSLGFAAEQSARRVKPEIVIDAIREVYDQTK
jgi:hypothetical protein